MGNPLAEAYLNMGMRFPESNNRNLYLITANTIYQQMSGEENTDKVKTIAKLISEDSQAIEEVLSNRSSQRNTEINLTLLSAEQALAKEEIDSAKQIYDKAKAIYENSDKEPQINKRMQEFMIKYREASQRYYQTHKKNNKIKLLNKL